MDEVLRVLESLQLTAKHKVTTLVKWKSGKEVNIAGSVSNDEAMVKFPVAWEAHRPHLRIIPQPIQRTADATSLIGPWAAAGCRATAAR